MKRFQEVTYWTIGVVLFLFGIFACERDSIYWSAVGFVLFSIPLATMLFRVQKNRYFIFVFAIFLALQAFLPSLVHNTHIVRQANLHLITQYEKDAIPGVSEGSHHFTTDYKGYRVTKAVDYAKPATYLRIFTIGGSTTEMCDLDDHKTWSHLMQQALTQKFDKNIEVVDAGMAGLRAEQNVATLKRITQYHPNLVTFLMGANDWRRHLWNHFTESDHSKSPFDPENSYSLKSSLLGRGIQFVRRLAYRALEKKGLRAVDVDPHPNTRMNPNRPSMGAACSGGVETFFPKEVMPSFSESLKEIQRICEEKHIPCILVTQPHGYSPMASKEYRDLIFCNTFKTSSGKEYHVGFETMTFITELYNNYVRTFAKTANMPLCDVAKQLAPSLENFYDDVHYTELGSERVSQIVSACVQDVLKKRGF